MIRQIYAVLAIAAVLCAYVGFQVYTMQGEEAIRQQGLVDIVKEYSEVLKESNENYEGKIELVDKEIEDIRKRIDEIRAESAGDGTGQESAEENEMLELITGHCDRNGLKLEKFYTMGYKMYSVRVSGTLKNINNANFNLMTELYKYGLSLGEMSLRQDYSAYNLKRSFDGTSLLEWYDSKFVNILGDVVSINSVKDPGVVIKKGSEEEGTGTSIDDEKRRVDIEAATKGIRDSIMGVESWHSIQRESIKSNVTYTTEEKTDQMELLTAEYKSRLAPLYAELERVTNRINEEYKLKVEEEKAKEDTVKNNLTKIQSTLANNKDLIYTYDFTFRVGV